MGLLIDCKRFFSKKTARVQAVFEIVPFTRLRLGLIPPGYFLAFNAIVE